jgi:prophage antirepressor-like protein
MSKSFDFNNPMFGSLKILKDENNIEYYRAIDVCSCLRLGNPTVAVKRHVKEKYVFQFDDGTNRAGLTNYVSEPGFYEMVFKSKTEIAEIFQDWIIETVLPSIRKDGGYISPDATKTQLQDLEAQIKTQLAAFETAYNLCVSENDDRGALSIKDSVQNLADRLSGKFADVPKDWLSISEILERRNYRTSKKDVKISLSEIGKRIKKTYELKTGLAVKKTTKAVGSGHSKDGMSVYPPDWFDNIEAISLEYWKLKNIDAI